MTIGDLEITHECLTSRQYAAIQLRIPESGTPWLDGMIAKANRRDIAKAALQGWLASFAGDPAPHIKSGDTAAEAFDFADAMIERSKR